MRRKSLDRITIRHVAQEAGVSAQTVSRVINKVPGVREETRRNVQATVDRLGYRPNAIARSLSRRRTGTLGVVATGIEYYGPSRTLVGIEQKANAIGLSLNLKLLHQPETDAVAPLVDGFLSRQVDGIIWATQEIGGNLFFLESADIPVPIVFLEARPRKGVYNINVDSRRGGRIAVRHLVSKGFRRIGVVAGPLAWWSARERLQGWRDALAEADLFAEDRMIVEGNWSAGSGARGLEQLIGQFPEMDSVFVCNDQMALGVLQTCRKWGRRIPEDLGIVGYDDIPEAAYFWPPLTTVRQDLMAFGGSAVDLVSRLIAARQETGGYAGVSPDATWLEPELIVRSSA